MNLEEGNKKP